jgi:hypothetical protein
MEKVVLETRNAFDDLYRKCTESNAIAREGYAHLNKVQESIISKLNFNFVLASMFFSNTCNPKLSSCFHRI